MAEQPEGMTPPGAPPTGNPREMVKLPALMLIVTAGVGAMFCLLMLLLNVLGTGLSALSSEGGQQVFNLLSGGVGIFVDILGIALAGFLVYGALQMKALENYTMAVMASVIAMIPCLSPCCVIGLPAGIWALVILLKPEVKAAFAKK